MPNTNNFEQMLEDSLKQTHLPPKGSIIETTVLQVTSDSVVVDVSAKTEASIPRKEFTKPPTVGSTILVYVENVSNSYIKLSYTKALKQKNVALLKEAFEQKTLIKGTITKVLPKGFLVNVMGWEGFLPLSQASIKRDPLTEDEKRGMFKQSFDFMILSLEEKGSDLRILLTLRGQLEQDRLVKKKECLEKLTIGEVLNGKVLLVNDKNALVEIAPDCVGLVRRFDISWSRIQSPTDVLKVGDVLPVKVLSVDLEKLHVLLSIKEAKGNIWEDFLKDHPLYSTVKGTVEAIEPTYLILKIEEGIQGILHVSNISWDKTMINMKQSYHIGQEIEVMIVKIDPQKRKIDFGVKQLQENPWDKFEMSHPIGSSAQGIVIRKSPFALFVEVDGITGMLHKNDLSWNPSDQRLENYDIGSSLTVNIVSFNKENQRLSLSLKDVSTNDPWKQFQSVSIGDTLSATIKDIPSSGGIVLSFSGGLELMMPNSQVSRNEELKVGDEVSVLVTDINLKRRFLKVSMRALSQKEEKETLNQYISSQVEDMPIDNSFGAALNNFFEKKSK